MKCEVEAVDPCNRKLKIEIPLSDYQGKIQAYYRKLGREVKVPGFRPGKVPVSIMEKRFGPEVKREVLTQLISESIAQGIEENSLRAVGEPSVVEVQAEEGTDISVTANVEVVPDIEVKDYSTLEVPIKIARVTEAEVDEVIETYRQQKAKNVPVTDRPVQMGDLIKIDFETFLDGKPIENGATQDYVIEVGSKNLVDGFDDQVIGMQLGEEKTFELKLPADHPNPSLAGQTVGFRVVLKGIQEKQLPELDDEFAKTADPKQEYQTMADLRAGVRKGLEEYERKKARKEAAKELAVKLGEANPIDVPEKLVQEQIAFMVKQEKQKAGEPHEHDHEPAITPEDEKKHREAALKILQQELVIGKLADDLAVEVTEQELDQELKNFATLLGGGDFKKIKKDWAQSGALVRLHTRMRREKTLNQLLDKVRLKEEIVDREDLKSDN